ncbi:conjugal transfer protein, partial [Kurthia sp. 3B1D]
IRVIAIIDYPKSRYGNWLSELKRKKGNITIVQFLESSNSTKMVEHYNKTIKNKQAEVLKTFDPLKKRQLEKQVEAAEHQLMKFLENESSYIYQYTYIYLQAKSLDELNALSDSVHNTLVKLQLKAMTPIKAMYQTFWSAMPILENLLGDYTYKQSNTEAASSMFPFDDAEILTINPRSDVEGVNKDTGSLIAIDYLDRKNTLNQNMVVIGTSGVGKTTYMVQKILRYFARGVKVFIIDPENEYTNIVEHLGGTVVHLSSNSSTKINPLEVFSEQVMDEGPVDLDMVLKDKIQRLLGFFQVLKQDITQVEKAILDAVLREVYRDAGILKYTSFLEIPSTAYPILSDVYEAIAALKARDADRYARIEDFHYILESYVNGSKTIFNGHTNINLQSDLLSFDLKSLQNEADVQGAAYLNTFSYLWDNITENTSENVKLFVDEFHFLTQNPDAASF